MCQEINLPLKFYVLIGQFCKAGYVNYGYTLRRQVLGDYRCGWPVITLTVHTKCRSVFFATFAAAIDAGLCARLYF